MNTETQTETQICPRRMEPGPWNYPDTDTWDRREGANSPRKCSFCGGVHPDDAIELLESGKRTWGQTDKSYKGYLMPNHEKFYIQHFDKEQVDRLNAAIRKPREAN